MEIKRWLRGAGAHLIGPVSNLEHALDRSKPDELGRTLYLSRNTHIIKFIFYLMFLDITHA